MKDTISVMQGTGSNMFEFFLPVAFCISRELSEGKMTVARQAK